MRRPPHPNHTPTHHTNTMGERATQRRRPPHRHPSRHATSVGFQVSVVLQFFSPDNFVLPCRDTLPGNIVTPSLESIVTAYPLKHRDPHFRARFYFDALTEEECVASSSLRFVYRHALLSTYPSDLVGNSFRPVPAHSCIFFWVTRL